MILRRSLIRRGYQSLRYPNCRIWIRSITTHDPGNPHQLPSKFPPKATPSLADNVPAMYREFKRQQALTNAIGPVAGPIYHPHDLIAHSPSPEDITLELLLASETHLGHSTSLWNPANAQYIYGIRDGIHIISLEVTATFLRRACRVVSGVTERGGLVLWVGTRKGQKAAITQAALRSGGCHIFERWIPGSISNAEQLLGHCKKKLVDEFDREIKGYEREVQDRAVLKPDLVVCLNPLENKSLLKECSLSDIPTIAIIDTDANPTWVTYPIPANDDSSRSVDTIAGILGKAGRQGKEKRLENAKNGIIKYSPIKTSDLRGEAARR